MSADNRRTVECCTLARCRHCGLRIRQHAGHRWTDDAGWMTCRPNGADHTPESEEEP